MKHSFFNDFFKHPRVRRVFLGILMLLVYWAGTGFNTPYWVYNLTHSSSRESAIYQKGEFGRGFSPESAMVAMDSMVTSVLPPFPEEGGDLSKYDEVGARIIKTGSVSMDVKDTNATLTTVNDLAKQYGGFVQSSTTWLNHDDTLGGSVMLRVESTHFEEAMDVIKQLATVVRSESISGQDVTEEYIDVQARLETLKAEEFQYLEILKKATSVEEILKVNDYLSTVRGEIESIQGRLQYLENQTTFSTISVDMTEEASVVAPTRDWQPVVVVKQAINQLVVAGQSLVNLFIWLVIFGAPVLLMLGLVWWGVKHFQHHKK